MYVIYDRNNKNKIVENVRHRPYRVTTHYKTMAAARAAITRMSKAYFKMFAAGKSDYTMSADPQFIYAVAEIDYYRKNLEKKVERVNLMTGKKYYESVNTPISCSPASETYWCM